MKRLQKILAVVLACGCLATSVFAANDLSVTGGATVTYDVDASYPWAYNSTYSDSDHVAYAAGNSGTTAANASNIGITVTEAGTVTFEYQVGTATSGSGGKKYGLYYNLNTPITTDNYTTADNYTDIYSYQKVTEWTTETITILESDLVDGEATLYIAYHKGGTFSNNGNYAAISNVTFSSGNREVDITTTGGGSVSGATDGEEYYIGTSLTLTATPTGSNRFYGWVYNDEFQHCETDFTFNVSTGANAVQAIFAADGTYEARGGGTFYTAAEGGIEAALSAAKSGETVMLLESTTLTSDIIVPEGVTLYVPFDENIYYDADTGEAVGFINGTNKTIAGSTYQYVELTVPADYTITVNGTLRVGGVNSGVQGGYQGHVSGAYGEIVNNGTITTNSGSTLDVLGLITGDGIVNAQSGSSVYEGFIVADYTGGTNTLGLFSAYQAPFQHYAMQNIQTTFTIGSGSTLYGYCTLVTGNSSHNRTIAPIMSSDEKCLFQFAEEDTTVTRTYSADAVSLYPGLGQMTYDVVGGLNFQSLTLEIMGITISTEGVSFPIPYTYAFNLTDGDYEVSDIVSFLPGAELYVASDATLTVPSDAYRVETDSSGNSTTYFAALNIMDGLHQSTMSERRYPYAGELEAAGYPQSAVFVVDGTFTVENAAGFCGLVQTNGSGSIETEALALLSMSKFQLGGLSSYDDNRTWMDVSARVNTADGIGYLIAGEEYTATNGTTFTQPDYSLLWMVNSDAATYADYDTSLGLYDVGYMSVTSSYGTYHILESMTVTGEDDMVGTWIGNTINYQYYVNLSSGDNTDAEVGDTISVTVTVAGDSAFDDADFIVSYDDAVLEYVSCDFSSAYFGVSSSTSGEVNVIGISGIEDGCDVPYTIGALTFKVLATNVDTSLTTSSISINPVSAETPIIGDSTTLTTTLGNTAVEETTTTPTVDETTSTATATVDVMVSVDAGSAFTVYATTENTEPTETTVVDMPTTFVKQLDEADSLTVEVDYGSVTFNSDALDEIATSDTMTAKLTVSVVPSGTTTTVSLDLVDEDGEKITFAGDDTTGTATVTVPYELEDGATAVEVYYIDGTTRTKIEGASYDNGNVTFTTTHFSDFDISSVSEDGDEFTVTVSNVSYYASNESLVAGVNYVAEATTTSDLSLENGTVTFTVDLGDNIDLYTYQVTYTLGGEEVAEYNSDHSYTIDNVTDNLEITVTSYKLGDITGDGNVNSTDALRILYNETGKLDFSELEELIGDVSGDKVSNSTDALRVLYFETGKLKTFD